ncbi:MAG: cell division protein ZipA C-terminal FtsZ-binding domain-containing protein [Stenotrophobium sp.]
MSALQWSLLIVGVAVVIAIYFLSRREKKPRKEWTAPSAHQPAKTPAGDQMEIFTRTGEFDEFGVGKPRRREAPVMPGIPEKPLLPPAEPAAQGEAAKPTPEFLKPRSEPSMGAAKPAPVAAAPKPVEQKIVAILIAEREGTAILGPKLHKALQQQALSFGERKIYHRMEMGQPLFSVAGLLKPGQLDPAEAATFATPGLTVFMVLPGPSKPVLALRDLLDTAKALARSINAELFDAKRQPFTAESERAMVAEVEDWARRNA